MNKPSATMKTKAAKPEYPQSMGKRATSVELGAKQIILGKPGYGVCITATNRWERWMVDENGDTYFIRSQPTFQALWARLSRNGYRVEALSEW
jgi:hypothetical protein